MAQATESLINGLCDIIDKNKYLLLEGGLAVGKTFIAKQIVERSCDIRYCNGFKLPKRVKLFNVISEVVQVHPSYSYEDFVYGISMQTKDNNVCFEYQDKIFLSMIKKANASWDGKKYEKFFLIIDDINRGYISGILGDALSLIEPHGNCDYQIKMYNGDKIRITPNIYIIATKNTSIDSLDNINYGFARHFYSVSIESDLAYLEDGANRNAICATLDVCVNALYNRAYRIVEENLSSKYRMSYYDKQRYALGHGLFKNKYLSARIKRQVVPLLKQYVKDGVLERTALPEIDFLQKLVISQYTKDYSMSDSTRIETVVKGVDSNTFYTEGGTHRPLVNIIARIKEQGLLSDLDIMDGLLFNPNVLVRTKAHLNNEDKVYSKPGYLYVRTDESSEYIYGRTMTQCGDSNKPRNLYASRKKELISIDEIKYSIAQEMQPNDFTRWSEDILDETFSNERVSTSPNTILFLIVKNYYARLIKNYESYLKEWPSDINIEILKELAKEEWKLFVEKNRNIVPASNSNVDNNDGNSAVRKAISELVLLWKNRDEIISWGSQNIKVEGVYKVDTVTKCKEFFDTMDKLDIHQMIMQGPPGTSKTYSTRKLLKFIGKGKNNDEFLSDKELDEFQISRYDGDSIYSTWCNNNGGQAPNIAWDIVQFHPSYGYEDFVRGIEVSTVKDEDEKDSHISYDTVNKILGRMAAVASTEKYKDTFFYLVIDEINRANLATVFGELIYGLEYRNEGVATPYTVSGTNKITLPDNLFIIGTMNTADKSIGGIDYAIRRRFLFFSLLPDSEAIEKFNLDKLTALEEITEQENVNAKAIKLFNKVSKLFDSENLNSEYYKEDVQIGHTYFLVNSEEQLFLRFKYQILPILREYHKDGMFQFEDPGIASDEWSGLLGCISGSININTDETAVKRIFDDIVSYADTTVEA